jgi:hypothetical protein
LVIAILFGAHNEVRAEGFTINGYGKDESRKSCMERAERALVRYQVEYSLHSIDKLDWAMVGYDMNTEGDDAIMMCPLVDEKVELLLTIHGDTEASRLLIQTRLTRYLE